MINIFMDTIFEKRDGLAITFHIKYEEDKNKWLGNYAKRKKHKGKEGEEEREETRKERKVSKTNEKYILEKRPEETRKKNRQWTLIKKDEFVERIKQRWDEEIVE